jgi:hypothetical protein
MSGKLKQQPCLACGDSRVEAHHQDYAQPDHVVWVCRSHHRDLHQMLKQVIAKRPGLRMEETEVISMPNRGHGGLSLIAVIAVAPDQHTKKKS